ncbi:MAG: ATPase [Nitrospirae bacterium CG08_land_8_20_14_0_20_52_24]|nr:MAG: ATPase [Nitrospirae bacterium CG08_land_8_20_14_0_20_52_24]PIX84748.1 MAG: ATPase [Nitrospirae bacterium CG_4_10_14_3_um_filter_53_41]
MNDNHSRHEFIYKPRCLQSFFEACLPIHPIIVLTGARQTGKSTFLQYSEPVCNWRYITLDNFDIRHQAEINPSALWAGADAIVIDEVQNSPLLLSAVKMAVDDKKRRVRFVLSGSANLLLMRRVSETLAGRAVYLRLYPMTLGEIRGRSVPSIVSELFSGELPPDGKVEKEENDPFAQISKGFMPSLMSLDRSDAVTMWWEGYVATYLERDLRALSQIESLADFRRVMEMLALRSGQMLNQTEISRDAGISQSTVHRYINLIETSCLAERLPAFHVNRTKRLIKAPKFYWLDSGLAAFLAGFHDLASVRSAREAGALFETFILQHLRVLSDLLIPKARVYYWRTVNGKEVDFVIEHGRKLLAVEVKLTSVPLYADIEGLKLFMEEYPETSCGLLVYNGNEIRRMDERIVAVPWSVLTG